MLLLHAWNSPPTRAHKQTQRQRAERVIVLPSSSPSLPTHFVFLLILNWVCSGFPIFEFKVIKNAVPLFSIASKFRLIMDANQIVKKKLFICKFCNKKYPCGKSLGGHIRIHLNGNNGNSIDAEEEVDLKPSKKDSDSEAAGYVLRENPKKTRRFTMDSNKRNLLCKECGKGFQSLKALCGHMASHSKASFEDQSETTEKLKEHVFDSQSDTETSSAPSKRRRSARMRYRAVDAYNSLPNSDVSDDVELEQEEVALCLMMLSRDSGFKGCFAASVAGFADQCSPKLRISVKNGVNCANEPKEQKLGYGFREGIIEAEVPKEKSSETVRTPSIDRNRTSQRSNGYESDETSTETEHVPNRRKIQSLNAKSQIPQNAERRPGSKKGKVHECPFCSKVFRSGQALGGHKRSHFVGGSEDRTVVIDNQVPEVSMSGLIDLNFPPPMEEDTNSYYLASW